MNESASSATGETPGQVLGCLQTLLTVAMGLYAYCLALSADLCPAFFVHAALLVSIASRTSEAAPCVHYTVPRPRGCGLLGGCARD